MNLQYYRYCIAIASNEDYKTDLNSGMNMAGVFELSDSEPLRVSFLYTNISSIRVKTTSTFSVLRIPSTYPGAAEVLDSDIPGSAKEWMPLEGWTSEVRRRGLYNFIGEANTSKSYYEVMKDGVYLLTSNIK